MRDLALKRSTIRNSAGLASVLAIVVTGAAQAQEPWPFVSFEVKRYDSLIDTDEDVGLPCCAPHVVAIPGHALFHVSAVIDVPWSEELDTVSISSDDMPITVPGAEPIAHFGHYANVGMFVADSSSLYTYMPNGWPDTDEHLYIDAVWALPSDSATATLTLGEYFSYPFELPHDSVAPLTAGDTANFEITALTPVERIEVETSNDDQGIFGVVAPEHGTILRVDHIITPVIPNWIGNRYGFSYSTGDIQLVGPNGLPTLPLGQHLSTALTSDTSNSISGDQFLGEPYEKAFFFLTDGSPGTYTLYFQSDPVAEAVLP